LTQGKRRNRPALILGRTTKFLPGHTPANAVQESRERWDIRDVMQLNDEESFDEIILNAAPVSIEPNAGDKH
jgi:hypothetical protein